MSDLATDTAGPLALDAFARLAKLQVLFTDRCVDEACPLTEVQRTLLAHCAAQAADGTLAEFAETLTMDSELRVGGFDRLALGDA